MKLVQPILFLAFLFLESNGYAMHDIECIDGKIISYSLSRDASGNIYSPGFKERKPYPTPMSCAVILEAQKEEHVRLTFDFIDIALNPNCQDDKLLIIETEEGEEDERGEVDAKGEEEEEEKRREIKGLFCGNVQVYDLISTGNQIQIQFGTTPFGTGLGFNITYRTVTDTTLCKPGQFQCMSRRCIPDQNIQCNGIDDCGDGTDEEDCNYPAIVPEKCGIPNVQPDTGNSILDRVVGGREAVKGSWPWQVDMQSNAVQPNGHFCGGTLINSQWFITAAHCVIADLANNNPARIHLGNHHKYRRDPHEEIRYTKKYFAYGLEEDMTEEEAEEKLNMEHDFALVKLNAPVQMNPHIQVACLPDLDEELKVGQICFATGWGDTRGSGSESVLKQAIHPIQNATKCYNIFEEFHNETMICAGSLEPLNGLCHGDSGGPLACKKDGKWHIYGATSFGTDANFISGLCGIRNKVSVFNKVSRKISWIRSIIANNS